MQQQYERGKQNTHTGNFDYATELLTSCVAGDPSSQFYTEAFLANLHRKYSSGKKGGLLSSLRTAGSTAGPKTSMANANRKKDWPGVMKAGWEVLKVNPFDTDTLRFEGIVRRHLEIMTGAGGEFRPATQSP